MLDKKVVSQCISSDYCRGWNDAVDAMPRWISLEERDLLLAKVAKLEAENASLRSERDIAVKALISVSDKVEMVQEILDDDIFHRVEYDVYLQLRDLVDNEIMSWQYEPENSDGTQEDNNAESS